MTTDVTSAEEPSADAVAKLRSDLRGELILPRDAGYEHARHAYNAMIDRRPAAIIRCADVADVIATVAARPRRAARPVGARRQPQRARLRHQ